MAHDTIRPGGAPRATTPQSGDANPRTVPVLAVVKSNIDPLRSGRLSVFLTDFGAKEPNDSKNWITVSYMSPFYGLVSSSGPTTGPGDYTKNSSSYGMWNSPPDIGSTVVCIFINGDSNLGYYIGCVPDAKALHMVPAIGGAEDVVTNAEEAKAYGGATRLPVTNINTNNKAINDSTNFLNETKPVHSYVAGVLSQQGLIRDPIRGVIGTSAQRESPSRVGYGVNTPGRPIFQGGFTDETIVDNLDKKTPEKQVVIARRAGHSFVMDDGDILGRDQLIRLRTSTGHQILMSDDGQCLFIIHANGQSWIELGKEGTIDMYAANSVNIRTQGDLNLHADNNININAAKTLNIAAEKININSEKETTQRVGADFNFYGMKQYTVKVDAGMSMASAGIASYRSDSTIYLNGSIVNLNTGTASLIPKAVKAIPIVAHTDTLHDSVKGFAPAPGKLKSIVSRAPAHAPWAPAGEGVDVKVNLSSEVALPAPSSPALGAANAAAPAIPSAPLRAAVIATVPGVETVSSSIDAESTTALIAATSTLAGTGIAAAAIAKGVGMVSTAAGPVIAIGALGMNATQMVVAGILKPGADRLIEARSTLTSDPKKLLSSNMFTGLPGAGNLKSFLANPVSQAAAMVTTLKKAETGLIKHDRLKNNMAGASGVVLAAATRGLGFGIGLLDPTGPKEGTATKSILGSAINVLSAGNYAGKVATINSGVSAITKALGGTLNSALGGAGGAFASVLSKFTSLPSGIPMNLKTLVPTNLQSLMSGVMSGPAAVIASMSSAIKLPTSVLNTVVRGGIDDQVKKVFGDTRIPVPNYKGNPATTGTTAHETKLDEKERLAEVFFELLDQRDDLDALSRAATLKWKTLATDSPDPADPAIAAAKSEATAAYSEYAAAKIRAENARLAYEAA